MMNYVYILEVIESNHVYETHYYFNSCDAAVDGFIQLVTTRDPQAEFIGIAKALLNSLDSDYVDYFTKSDLKIIEKLKECM